MHNATRFIALLCCSLSLVACQTLDRNRSANLSSYLAPDVDEREPSQTQLKVPLRVGVALVPGGGQNTLSAVEENALLSRIAEHFRGHEVIADVVVIPSTYLSSKGGYAELERVAKLFDVQALTLLSYDQSQYAESTPFSFFYWTILGAYVLPSESTATNTLLDAAVIHVPSRRLLFRAGGTSAGHGLSTAARASADLRAQGVAGYRSAIPSLLENLDTALRDFRARVPNQPTDFVVNRQARR